MVADHLIRCRPATGRDAARRRLSPDAAARRRPPHRRRPRRAGDGPPRAEVGFEIWVLDDRKQYITPERFPSATRRMVGDVGRLWPS